jgi:ABC-type transport system involved in cytochrome c biogenesis permease subunit
MIRLFLTFALAIAAAVPGRALDFKPLETMPVQEGGRKKPYFVFAEESLLSLSGKTELTIDGRSQSAQEIITGIWLAPDKWSSQPLILINNLAIKKASDLDEKRKWFSRDELASSPGFIALLNKADADRRTAKDGKLAGTDKQVDEIGVRISTLDSLRRGELFRVIANPSGAERQWSPLPVDDQAFSNLRTAFSANDDTAFAKAAGELRAHLAAQSPQFQPQDSKLQLEVTYQKLHPFRWAWILYLAAGITLALTSVRGRRAGYIVAWLLAGAGLLFQISGFVTRIVIAGRPPVSNMYESVIWVAFGAVLFSLIFEAIYRGRYFLLGASFAAVIPLLLADSQPLALNRSIQPLVPVLQSNFWLSTHVLIITLSYAAFLLALGVGHIALGKVILGRKPSAALYNYIYRTLQVGVLMLAVGTILGGVWANYSWGRFWDWDPKETWALTALLVYLFVLHGRIAGSWSGFGLAVGAVLAFQSIVMSWYGVNFVLGVGLHSYGFGSGGFGYAATFVITELAFTAAAILRHRSARKPDPAPENAAGQVATS